MINSDDPRLTAYVLGELDEAGQTEVERAIAASPELESEVESIRQTAALLDTSLGADSGAALTDEQRQVIHEQSAGARVQLADHSAFTGKGRWHGYGVALTTAGIVAIFLVPFLLPDVRVRTAAKLDDNLKQGLPSATDHSAEHPFGDDSEGSIPAIVSSPQPSKNKSFDRGEVQIREHEPSASIGLSLEVSSREDFDGGFGFEQKGLEGAPPALGGFATAGDGFEFENMENMYGGMAPAEGYGETGAPRTSSMETMESLGRTMGDRRSFDSEDRYGMSEPAEDTPAGVSNFGSTQGRSAFRRVDPLSESGPDPMGVEEGRLIAGKGLPEDLSTARVETEGRVVAGRPQRSVSEGLGLLEEEAENSSVELNEHDSTREAQVPRQLLSKSSGRKEELREELTPMKPGTDADEITELAPAVPKQTWRRAQATPNASRLVIGDRDELMIEGMQANVMVDGFRARVLLDLYYFNDRGRQLEGNFKLRLPDDASLYYFAFGESAYEYRPQVDRLASKGFLKDEFVRAAGLSGLSPEGIVEARRESWNKVKEARLVPRDKAAHAYSETVRRRVDPALVEWSGAGVFNARVFPLMPNKLHRIVVGYDVNLQQLDDDLVYRLDLPQDVSQCMVDLNVSALPGASADIQPAIRPFVSGGRAFYHFDEVKDDAIELRFSGTGPVLLQGKDSQAGDFFAARVTPQLDAGEMQAGAERATFLVDTSLSARPDKFNVWLRLMEATLANNRDTLKEFSVLFFNIDSHWWKNEDVENTRENVDALMTYCHSLSLEGATDLRQALREATLPTWADESIADTPRDLFLISDGAVTWGEMNLHHLSRSIPAGQTLFAYNTGMSGTSIATLEHLARETGGAVFSVVNEHEVAAAATAHRSRPWKLIDVMMAGGSDLLVAGRPQTIYPGQPLLIVGRGEPDAEVMLKVSRGDEVSQRSIKIERVVESDLAARAYGQVAVGQLEELGSSLEDVSVAYARHFRVTGQTCSLLMLESEADYERFRIKPEDDLFVVRSTPSADLINKKLDELTEQLSDAKASVVAWLDKLQDTAGFQFELPTALRLVIDRLPQSVFAVEPTRLVCKSQARGELRKEFIQQLDSGKLDYDAVTVQAIRRHHEHGASDGLRTLSSLIEQNPGDPVLTRDVAYSAIEWGLGDQAFPLLRRVAVMRPYEPQSYLAMAQCLVDIGRADLAMIYYEVVLQARWHERYKDVRDIATIEYLRLLRRIDQGELSGHAPEYAKARLASLAGQTAINRADLVVTMMWNTDRTDVDLHVLEPTGEECFYNHPRTRIGGYVTRDVTEGLGPEMYTLQNARPGDYKIMANYYGSDANRTKVRTKVYISVYRDFGDKQEQVEKKTVTLSDQKEKRELTTVRFKM